MLATAAVVPLLMYGVASVYTLRVGTRRTVDEGNANVARQVGEQVRRYISTNLQDLPGAGGRPRGHGSRQRRSRTGSSRTSSCVSRVPRTDALRRAPVGRWRRAAWARPSRGRRQPAPARSMGVTHDAGRRSTTTSCRPPSSTIADQRTGRLAGGSLVGQFSIEELWRMVDRIHIGQQGVALIVGAGGELLAHGDPDERPRVARGEHLANHPVVSRLRGHGATGSPSRCDVRGAGRPRRRCPSACASRNSTGACWSSSRTRRRSRWRGVRSGN